MNLTRAKTLLLNFFPLTRETILILLRVKTKTNTIIKSKTTTNPKSTNTKAKANSSKPTAEIQPSCTIT